MGADNELEQWLIQSGLTIFQPTSRKAISIFGLKF